MEDCLRERTNGFIHNWSTNITRATDTVSYERYYLKENHNVYIHAHFDNEHHMEPQHKVLMGLLLVIVAIGSFVAGMNFTESQVIKEVVKEECEQSASLQQPGQIGSPVDPSLLAGNITPPPPISGAGMPIFGTIDSIQSGVIVLKTVAPPISGQEMAQNEKRVLVGGETKILMTVVSTDQAKIAEFEKNLPKDLPEGIPTPKLYEQKEGSISDLKVGMSITAFGDKDIQNVDEFTATQIMIPPTG